MLRGAGAGGRQERGFRAGRPLGKAGGGGAGRAPVARKCSGVPCPRAFAHARAHLQCAGSVKPAPAQLVKARGPVRRLRSWGLGVGPARAWGGLCRDVGWASVSFLCRGGLCPLEYCCGHLRRSSGSLLGLPMRWGAGRTEPMYQWSGETEARAGRGYLRVPACAPPRDPPILSEPCWAMADGFLGIGCSGKGRQEPTGQARC